MVILVSLTYELHQGSSLYIVIVFLGRIVLAQIYFFFFFLLFLSIVMPATSQISYLLTLQLPGATKREFLLYISIQCQTNKL